MQTTELRQLMGRQFEIAKQWWFVANLCRVLVLGIGIFSILANTLVDWLSLVASGLTIGYWLAQWQSDKMRDTAETLLRKIEMHDGLGWLITKREIADFCLQLGVQGQDSATQPNKYFTSEQPTSAQRMLENLCESLWFTRHQAARMSQLLWILSVLVVVLAFAILIAAWYSAAQLNIGINAAKIAVAIIVFYISAGYIRLAHSYGNLAEKARWFEREIDFLQKQESPAEIQAAKLLHEYQIVRVKSPMLPSWLWSMMEKQLNALWLSQKTT